MALNKVKDIALDSEKIGILSKSNSEVVSVKYMGAKGDGTTNDTAAIQSALDAVAVNGGTVILPLGTYLITSPIYIYGNVNIIGVGNAIIKVRMASSQWMSIALGAKASTPSGNYVWSGRIEGLTFDCGGNTNNGNIMNVFRAKNYIIEKCVFLEPYSTPIKGSNNGAYANDNQIRENGHYKENIISVVTTVNPLGEGISINAVTQGYVTRNIYFLNNIIEGLGDDPLAVHGEVENVFILDNQCKTIDGRVYVANAKNVKIDGNKLSHTADNGWYLNVGLETAGDAQPQNIQVTNNEFNTPTTGGANANYIMRFDGVKKLKIHGNTLNNNLADKDLISGIEITDSTTPNAYNSSEVNIQNNKLYRCFIKSFSVSATDTVIMNNDVVGGYIYLRNKGYYKNNKITPHTGENYIYRNALQYVKETKLCEFMVTLPNATTFTMSLPNGLSSYLIEKEVQICHYVVTLSGTYTSGFISVDVKTNGSVKDSLAGLSNLVTHKILQVATDSALEAADVPITITGSTIAAVGTNGIKMVVEIYGAYSGS